MLLSLVKRPVLFGHKQQFVFVKDGLKNVVVFPGTYGAAVAFDGLPSVTSDATLGETSPHVVVGESSHTALVGKLSQFAPVGEMSPTVQLTKTFPDALAGVQSDTALVGMANSST